jgi:hypothetical protein
MGAVFNGLNKMKLVEGHRVLRYVIRTAFHQARSGDTDYRVIKRESFRAIAQELGLKGDKSIKNMSEVFYAMAFLNFKRPDFSGNLMTLKRFKSAKTNRLEGVELTLGTAILPYRACDHFKRDKSKLMIPLLPDPSLVGANQYHAGQYLLQMLVMEEFVRKSVNFAKHGYIKIPQTTWQKMAQECGVLPILEKILNRWTHNDSDRPKFLEDMGKNFYKLGTTYQKETSFLIEQGNLRIKQSKRGKVSAIKRIEAKK